MDVFTVTKGSSPLVLGQPHGGTHVPDEIAQRMNTNGTKLADTDWHITRVYDGLAPSATVVRSHIHRYVIDANRDPKGTSLYPGQNTTTLVPLTDFDGEAIWQDGQAPSHDEIEARRRTYHAPYHAALSEALDQAKARHGYAILFDCHSIRSHIPFLFDGKLPIFNTGTNNGTTCSSSIEAAVHQTAQATGQTAVLNGRFKGGWTTRQYGLPQEELHAIQMELAQRAYMLERLPWTYDQTRATAVRQTLKTMLDLLSQGDLS